MGNYLIGFQLMVVGMGTVLLTLYLLSLFIRVSSKIFNRNNTDEISEADSIDSSVEEGISTEKVAAISAAIYSCMGKDSSRYRIISIKRNKLNWNR